MLLGAIASVRSNSVFSKLAVSLECLKIPLKVISWIFLEISYLMTNHLLKFNAIA